MRIDIVTLFPELCDSFLSASILGRARAKNLFEAHCHQIRDYTKNKQKQTDDYPYGGGCGMVLYAQPIADCLRAVQAQCAAQGRARPHVVFLTAAGRQGQRHDQCQSQSKKLLHWNLPLSILIPFAVPALSAQNHSLSFKGEQRDIFRPGPAHRICKKGCPYRQEYYTKTVASMQLKIKFVFNFAIFL